MCIRDRPEGIIERLTPSQLEAVLAHESCHVRRRDNLTAALHMIVEGVFWFHPVVWWISAELVKERERACDEDVLRLGSQPQVYAEGILSICKFYVDSPLACVSGVTGADLKKRVKLIMRNHVGDPLNTWGKLFLAAAGVLALALPVVFGLLNATPSHAQSQAENNSAGVKASFESAGIKLDKSPSPKLHSQIYFPNRFIATSTARWLIEYAYSSRKETCDLAVAICNDEERGYPIFDDQIVGGPDWIKSCLLYTSRCV